MGVTIELQNLGDAQLCRDITAHLEHAFSGRQGDWRVSIAGSRAAENWGLQLKDPMALNGRILSRLPPVNTSLRRSERLF